MAPTAQRYRLDHLFQRPFFFSIPGQIVQASYPIDAPQNRPIILEMVSFNFNFDCIDGRKHSLQGGEPAVSFCRRRIFVPPSERP